MAARKRESFPQQSVHAALNAAVRSADHLTDDQRPVVALGRVLAKRVDKLERSEFVIDGRFDNVSAGMLLKVLDSLGLTVKDRKAARQPEAAEQPLVPSSSEPPTATPVTNLAKFRRGRNAG